MPSSDDDRTIHISAGRISGGGFVLWCGRLAFMTTDSQAPEIVSPYRVGPPDKATCERCIVRMMKATMEGRVITYPVHGIPGLPPYRSGGI
jgi:hypothetical protein